MQLKKNARVMTADGQELGRVDYVVVNPTSNEVTHLVIREGLIFTDERVVAFDAVHRANEDEVILHNTADQLRDRLRPFEEKQYVRVPETDAHPTTADLSHPLYAPPMYAYGYPPAVPGPDTRFDRAHNDQFAQRTERNVPDNTIALKEGARVFSSDNTHVGEIADIIARPDAGNITHFIISQGLLFKNHKVVPIEWVRQYAEDNVYLSVSTGVLESLPDYEVN